MLTYRQNGEKEKCLMANFFKDNKNNFNKAADYINQHCISFAGCEIKSVNSTFVFDCFAKAFSHCDDATASLCFKCVSLGGSDCIATVGVDGSVDICYEQYFNC